MCDFCDDELTNIPSGPAGPTGPTGPIGPTPILTGTSTSSLLIATGNKIFTTQSGISWVQGQRLRAVDNTNLNLMEGEVVSYTGTTLVLSIDHIQGAGTIALWTISIAGAVGPIGSTGASGGTGASGNNAYGVSTGVGISLGANLYTLPMAGTAGSWGVVGQIIYIQTAGYFTITAKSAGVSFTILDTLYPGNNTANLTSTSSLGVVPAGLIGATGSTGSAGSTGPAGPTGPTGPAVVPTVYIKTTPVNVFTVPVSIAVGSATTGGTLYLWGQVTMGDTGPATGRVDILINGVGVPIESFGYIADPAGTPRGSIPVCISTTVGVGDVISFQVSFTAYSGAGTFRKATLFYYII